MGSHRAMPIRVAGFKDVAWDFIGPFPPNTDTSGAVKTAIWTILSRGTGYTIMIPIKYETTAVELAAIFVERVYATTGIPETVLSDRDPKFTLEFWVEVLRLLRTKELLTTSFHPRTDGGVEGKHGIINIAMRTIVDSQQSNWLDCVPHVQFRLNCTPSATTGYTPFELCFGYVPMAFPMTPEYGLDTLESVVQFMETNGMKRRIAEDAIKLARIKQTEYENRSRGPTPLYQKGDRVLLSTKNLNVRNDNAGAVKWFNKWTGPFEVVGQRDTTVELKLPPPWAIHPRFHVELIKPYHGNLDRYDEPPPELVGDDGIPMYEVAEIVNDRWNGHTKRHEWRMR